MLSEIEKKEMLEDAQSEARCKAFRYAKELQEGRKVSWSEYLSFLDDMARLFPLPKRTGPQTKGRDFRL